jgi:hypothetical protein
MGMKQFLPITLAVFLGSVGAQLVNRYLDKVEADKAHAVAAQQAEAERQLKEQQGKILREIFSKARTGQGGLNLPELAEPQPSAPAVELHDPP